MQQTGPEGQTNDFVGKLDTNAHWASRKNEPIVDAAGNDRHPTIIEDRRGEPPENSGTYRQRTQSPGSAPPSSLQDHRPRSIGDL